MGFSELGPCVFSLTVSSRRPYRPEPLVFFTQHHIHTPRISTAPLGFFPFIVTHSCFFPPISLLPPFSFAVSLQRSQRLSRPLCTSIPPTLGRSPLSSTFLIFTAIFLHPLMRHPSPFPLIVKIFCMNRAAFLFG